MSLRDIINKSLDAPWKAKNEVLRMFQFPLARLYFFGCGIRWGNGWRIFGLPILQKHCGSSIRIGRRLSLRSTPSSNPLSPSHPVVLCTWRRGSEISIGDDFSMTGGTICADVSVRIGDRVNVGANSVITDTDFHSLSPDDRRMGDTKVVSRPVVIGSDIFIGMNCLILKGVHIGSGSVIGAGSVITKDVPSGMIFAGNPAILIGRVPGD